MIKNIKYNISNKNTKIIIENDIVNKEFNFLNKEKKYVVITDTNLDNLYHDLLKQIPNLIDIIVIPSGEISKNFEIYKNILNHLSQINFSKNDEIISFGGGVVSDISLFVSSTYKRGVNIILIPTSLLAMVDASIGGKCGINLDVYKNQIGSFYFPHLIIIDINLLKTLPKNEYNNGLSEIVKYALLKDQSLFNELENNSYDLLSTIIKCINYKFEIINDDLYDLKERKLLNLGHTYGHIVESYSNYQISHGHAVAIGLVKEVNNPIIKRKLINLLSKYFNLKYNVPFEYGKKCLLKDKKISSSDIDIIQINEIGKPVLVTKKVEELINEYFWEKH